MKRSWKDIALLFVASYCLGMLLFPHRFLNFNATFVDYSDSLLSYAGAFYVTEGFYHGGIQLWNRYDQMPMTFFYMNFAMYKFSNVLTALVYMLLSPFSQNPAQLFHQVFSCIFISSALLVRIVGIYLLLGLFVRTRWILLAATVYGSLVLAPQFMMALSTNIIYSLFPLMVYFLLRYFKELRFKYLFWFLAVWGYCVSTDLFCGLGYLYQGTHFVIVPGIAWMFYKHRALLQQPKFFKNLIRREHLAKIGGLLLLTMVMFGPSLYLMKAHYSDYEFGVDQSRMKDPLSITKYFKRPGAWAPQEDFLLRSVDFTTNLWSLNWVYVGSVTVFFALLGLVAMRDSRKWILLAAIVLFYLINAPRDAPGLSAIAHWINALTNLLKFLPRSYHMACAMLFPFLLIPLAAAGFEWLWLKKGKTIILRITWALFGAFCIAVFGPLPMMAKKFLLLMGALLLVVTCVRHKYILSVGLLCIFAADCWAMSYYIRHEQDKFKVEPRPVLARPDLGLVSMEYQNPRILPVRHFGSLAVHEGVDTYLFESCTNMPGLMFRYTNFMRYYQRINNYLPRHREFSSWVTDQGRMFSLMNKDLRMMQMGIPMQSNINTAYLDPAKAASIHEKQDFKVYFFKNPDDLPIYYATTFLSPEETLFRLALPNQALTIAQGALVKPYSFDVNNVRDGFIAVALPKSEVLGPESLRISYPAYGHDHLMRVTKNNLDDFGFVYQAPKDGQLILREPYDPKWRVSVDGKEVPVTRVNQSFMAVNLTQGEHEVRMRYWPNTPIRIFLGIAIVVSLFCLIWILHAGMKEE